MASEDSSFNSSGDTVVAFATINSKGRPAFGVSADANTCGVYGQSARAHDPHSMTASPSGTGVLGRGDFHGVYGVSSGVDDTDTPDFSTTSTQGMAVVGVNDGESPAILADNGILRADVSGVMDDLRLPQMGVAGMTRIGPGVFGVSLSNHLKNNPNIHDTVHGTEFTDGTNVRDAGVVGLSVRGPGVRGVSQHDRGGVFESAREGDAVVAQLRLFPAQPDQLRQGEAFPTDHSGEAGDLLALNHLGSDGTTFASLWFCAAGASASPTHTAYWIKIV